MSKAGLIDTPSRGVFVASEKGKKLLDEGALTIDVEMLKTYPEFVDFYMKTEKSEGSGAPVAQSAVASDSTPEEQIDAAHAAIEAALKAELLQRVLSQSPAFFERLIVELLVAMGYGGTHERAALNLGKSGDGGVDGVIDEDRLGLDRIYVQAKRYAPHLSIGRPEVQGFVGSLVGLGATKGVFVTTSTYSVPAIQYVKHLQQRIVLIDGDRLAELLIEHNVGVRIKSVISVKRVDEEFFIEE